MSTNSLAELNTHSNTEVTATDDRTYSITYSTATSTATVNKSEGDSFNPLATFDGSFTNIQSIDNTGTGISIEINLSNNPRNDQFSFGTLPSGVVENVNSTGGIYSVNKIYNKTDFATILANATLLLQDVETNFTYTIKVEYPSDTDSAGVRVSDTQTVTINITSTSDELEVNTIFAAYEENQSSVTVNSGINILDTESPTTTTYTFTIAHNSGGSALATEIASFAHSGSPASFLYTSGVLTITGTKTQVQGTIDTLTFVPQTGRDVDYTVKMTLTSVASGKATELTSSVLVSSIAVITNTSITRSYTENVVTNNLFSSSPPQTGTGIQSDTSCTINLEIVSYLGFNTGLLGYLKNFDNQASPGNALKTLSFTGTPAQMDTFLSSKVMYIPPPGEHGVQYIKYTMTGTPSGSSEVGYIKLDGTADATPVSGAGTVVNLTAAGNTSVSIADNQRYFLRMDVLMVAPGSAGGDTNPGQQASYGGGGSAGHYLYIRDCNLATNTTDTTLRFVLGTKGTITGNATSDTVTSPSDTYVEQYNSSTSGTKYITLPGPTGGVYNTGTGQDAHWSSTSSRTLDPSPDYTGYVYRDPTSNNPFDGTLQANKTQPSLPQATLASPSLTYLESSGTRVAGSNQLATTTAYNNSEGGKGVEGGLGSVSTSVGPYTNAITGSATNYASGGPGGGSSSSATTKPGDGGKGAAYYPDSGTYYAGTDGQEGFIFVKFYEVV